MKEPRDKYQLKRRRYGYGWTPVAWQSWLFIIFQITIIIMAATFLPAKPAQPTVSELVRFFIIFGSALGALLIYTTRTGPKAKWRWGKKPSDNPDEDF